MPLVDMKDMLQHAWANGYAVGAFDVVNLDFISGVMDAAEETGAPVILSLAESHFEYFDFALLMAAVETAAMRATVPVAIHLDHGESMASAVEAIRRGCNGVMVDASDRPLAQNIEITRELVNMAHGCGVPVEGELGYVPGVEGEDAARHPGEIRYTTVEEALRYVSETAVDFLAVSVGTVHGRMRGTPQLDITRLAEINAALNMPLVIHGGTGLDDAQFHALIENGVAKINYYTALSDAAAQQVRQNCEADAAAGFTSQVKDVPAAIRAEAARCMKLWGAAGRGAEVLACAAPWAPVEHLIIYNVSGLDRRGVHDMALEGKRILAAIPGVREVFIGESLRDGDRYRYTWLVRFCHPAVIESYRHHPDHVDFADRLFRPVAGDRISIDYTEILPRVEA